MRIVRGIVLCVPALLAVVGASPLPAAEAPSAGDADLRAIVQHLAQKQEELQKENAELREQLGELRGQLAALLAREKPAEEAAAPGQPGEPSIEELLQPEVPKESEGVQSATTVGALSFNPDISVVGDFVVNAGDKVPELGLNRNDTLNRAVEVSFSQRITPKAKAVVKLSYEIEREPSAPVTDAAEGRQADEGEQGGSGQPEEGLDLEEAYLQFDQLLPSTHIRLGRERVPNTLFNLLDEHELPFVNRPLPVSRFLGNEGLIEDGARISYLLPCSTYLNVDLGMYNSRNDVAFDAGRSNDRLWMGRLNGYSPWNRGEDEVSWGLALLSGSNDDKGHHTNVWSADLQYQHLKHHFDRWLADAGWLLADVEADDGDFARDGWFVHLAKRWDQYKLNQVGLLWESSEGLDPLGPEPIDQLSLYYTWNETERVRLRTQWSHADFHGSHPDSDTLWFQLDYVMGTHPPHD